MSFCCIQLFCKKVLLLEEKQENHIDVIVYGFMQFFYMFNLSMVEWERNFWGLQ